MQVYDVESVNRVARRRAQRADKGFTTIECEKDLAAADVPEGSIVILKDLVNLMFNEMSTAAMWSASSLRWRYWRRSAVIWL